MKTVESEVPDGAFCNLSLKVRCKHLKRSVWEADGYRCIRFNCSLERGTTASKIAKCKACMEASHP